MLNFNYLTFEHYQSQQFAAQLSASKKRQNAPMQASIGPSVKCSTSNAQMCWVLLDIRVQTNRLNSWVIWLTESLKNSKKIINLYQTTSTILLLRRSDISWCTTNFIWSIVWEIVWFWFASSVLVQVSSSHQMLHLTVSPYLLPSFLKNHDKHSTFPPTPSTKQSTY